jgi:hypothetical protein
MSIRCRSQMMVEHDGQFALVSDVRQSLTSILSLSLTHKCEQDRFSMIEMRIDSSNGMLYYLYWYLVTVVSRRPQPPAQDVRKLRDCMLTSVTSGQCSTILYCVYCTVCNHHARTSINTSTDQQTTKIFKKITY